MWHSFIDDLLRTDEDILWLISTSTGCCERKCFRKLAIEDIKYCERSMKRLKQTDRRNLILDYLHISTASLQVLEELKQHILWEEQGFASMHGSMPMTSKRKHFEDFTWSLRRELCISNMGIWEIKKLSKKTKDCIAWLEFFVDCVGQHQPDQSTIHLPSCFSISSIYKQMVEENNGFGIESVGLSHYYHVFHSYFPNVTIPKVSSVLNCLSVKGVHEIKAY